MKKNTTIIYYKEKIDNYNETLKHITKKCSMFLYGKLLFFFFAVLCCVLWMYLTKNDIVWMFGTICFIIYLILIRLDGKAMDIQRLIQKKIVILSNEISNLEGVFTNNNGIEYISVNHPYLFDIDIFGESSLFHRINRTITQEGADRLAQILSDVGIGKDTILQRQASISELEELNDLRLDFQCIGKRNNQFSDKILAAYPISLNVNILKWIVRISWFITATSILLLITCSIFNIQVKTILMILVSVIFINGIITVFFFRRSGKIMYRINSLISYILQYSPIVELCTKNRFNSVILNNIQAEFLEQKKSFSKLYSMSQFLHLRNNSILWIFVNCLAIIDIYTVLQFFLWERNHFSKLPQLLTEIGHLDALISLSNYNFNHPETIIPQFANEGVNVQNIYHPFIMSGSVVGNNYIQNENSISIITGANMSGKSTFLRTVALNLVLANAGCKVFADKFLFNPQIKLFTSMRTQDNITNGKSYFNAEIDRLAQAIDYNLVNSPTLLILDEVLKGTNSEDKLYGTLELLKFFSKRNFMVMVATHDIGVTSLESDYGELKFKNYCFEIELSEPITYSYKINRGICKNRNASYILLNMLSKKK
ncbi:DNA mismatch repair protein MutS [Prevotella jejuni]|uniref:MutS-related protein n=1 Tax=Prevotella jejuni TaxID=1177574 RepID=UPI0028F02CD8|nr:DNA mismatch repair protein MutS [Prevotella jejuni]